MGPTSTLGNEVSKVGDVTLVISLGTTIHYSRRRGNQKQHFIFGRINSKDVLLPNHQCSHRSSLMTPQLVFIMTNLCCSSTESTVLGSVLGRVKPHYTHLGNLLLCTYYNPSFCDKKEIAKPYVHSLAGRGTSYSEYVGISSWHSVTQQPTHG